MFSFISAGKSFAKKFSVYNSLATSAFVMLCYDPYFLWSVGFQLSYLAVIGIVIFQKPIYNCLYIKNKWVDKVWQLMAVSTAAQLLTFPVCIYYFHQFPNLFLITNIIAVPLAGVILYAEILLIAFSWIPFAGLYLGKLVGVLTGLMNKVILWVNDLSFAVWDKIPATVFSTWLLYAIVAGSGAWLITKNKNWFKFALISLLVFSIQHIYAKWQIEKQQKIIIYNVPQHQAIDFVKGSNYQFVGDSILLEDGMLQNFHLKPGRIFMQLNNRVDSLNAVFHQTIFYQYKDKKIGIINQSFLFEPQSKKTDVDILIISKNPGLSISQLANTFNCKLIVFDASNPLWKIEKWQKECMELNLKVYSIPSSGALVYNIGM
jgi:competence protein ComEC